MLLEGRSVSKLRLLSPRPSSLTLEVNLHRATHNLLIGAILLSIPMAAELHTATPSNVPGTGFDVLLYQPFDFAFVLLVMLIFAALNAYVSASKGKNIWSGARLGILITVGWFFVTFLAVGQLHLSLGGIL